MSDKLCVKSKNYYRNKYLLSRIFKAYLSMQLKNTIHSTKV